MHQRRGCWSSDLLAMSPAGNRVYKTLGYKEGEGSYGSVFQVSDAVRPTNLLVMKISVANANFFAEVQALEALQRVSPNIPILYDWFVTDQLPPNNNYWAPIRNSLLSSYQYEEINVSSSGRVYGFMVIEKASYGSLAKFAQNTLARSPPQTTWDMIDSILFQLIFTAAALPQAGVLHRDIGGANIMFTNTFNSTSTWNFRVGTNYFTLPCPSIKPLLIDYGSANLLRLGCDLTTDFRFTTLRYRAPEMIFLSDHPDGPLQPYYTGATDLFSIGMSLLELVLGDFTETVNAMEYDNHPFLRYTPPSILTSKLQELFISLKNTETDYRKDIRVRNWASTMRRGFIADDEIKMLSRYLWGMCYELGVPDNKCWPGVEQTSVWKILDEVIRLRRCSNLRYPTSSGFFFQRFEKLRRYLSSPQLDMICEMLRYNPTYRPLPSELLKKDFFAKFRNSFLTIDPESPIWTVEDSIRWNPIHGSHYGGL